MGKAKPTREALDAAREAVRLNPKPEWQSSPEAALEGLAGLYSEIGRNRFEAIFGLRPPRDVVEQASRDLFTGRLAAAEYDRLVSEQRERPVDESMIRLFYDRHDRLLAGYGYALAEIELQGKLVPSGSRAPWGIERIQRHIDDEWAAPFQDARELWEVNELARRARVQSHMDVIRFGGEEWMTAGDAAWHFIDLLRMTLKVSEGRIGPGGVDDVHRMLLKGGFQSARTLRNEAAREQDAVLLSFAAHAKEASPALKAEAVHIQADRCTVASANPAKPSKGRASGRVSADYLLTVQEWCDLAIGIDATKRPWEVWAVTPVPTLGRRFPKASAKLLNLNRTNWTELIRLAAQSPNGNGVSLHDLVVAWGLVTDSPRSSRGRPNIVEDGQVDADRLSVSKCSQISGKFRKDVDDLRRHLRVLISGPFDGSRTLLARSDTSLDTGFIVQFLMPDERGVLHFGTPRHPEKGG